MDSLGSMDLSELYSDLSLMSYAPPKPCRNFSVLKPVGTDSGACKGRTVVKISLRGLRPVEDTRKDIEAIISTLDSIRFDFSDLFCEDEESLFQINYRHYLGIFMSDQDHDAAKKGSRFSLFSIGEEKQVIDSFERESSDSEESSGAMIESQPVTNQFSKKCAKENHLQLSSQSGSFSPKSFIELSFAQDPEKWDHIGDSVDSESVDSCEFARALNQQVLDRYCRLSPKCQARRCPRQAQLSDSLDSDSVDSGDFLRALEDQPGPSHYIPKQYPKDKGSQKTFEGGTFPPKKPPRLSVLQPQTKEKEVVDCQDSESSDSREFMKPVEELDHPQTSQFSYPHHLKETGNQVHSQVGRSPTEKHVRFTSKEDKHKIATPGSPSRGSTESLIAFETSSRPSVSPQSSGTDEENQQVQVPKLMSVKELRDCLKVQDQPQWDTHDRDNDRFNELLKELWKMRKELDTHKNIFVNIVNQNLAIAEVVRVLHLERGDMRWSRKKKKWKSFKGLFRQKRIARILKVTKKRLGHISRFLRDVESDLKT